MVTLSNSQLGKTEGEKTIAISAGNVIYRIFDASISDNYFCASIPPTTPLVLKDVLAESGSINITTAIIKNENETSLTFWMHSTEVCSSVQSNLGLDKKVTLESSYVSH